MSKAPLNRLSGMPQIGAAFNGWETKIALRKIAQTIIDGLVDNKEIPMNFMGTWQPLSAEKIALKPEGMRSWKWIQLHCRNGSKNLETNDLVIRDGEKTRYKVMDKLDYSLSGFIEYHLVEDFQP